ncbi:ABC transporter ATP-binding protein [Streptomyces sp. NBC_01808]|uniref:ABC transporter ATP-binding protein n=1 Tax=Streptomyces sp. NBC_01808 TaxID=2975947 RepID=UPI002DD8AF28|nr:ABC transporter ATP-binding protein [Streptomyces sp. NBC_01808]WSA36061.1 ABC transporter ATP-binding protein [Streptomyces sp. NBC_01808]
MAPEPDPPLLDISDLKTHFDTQEGTVRAVDGVSFTVPRGRIVCVVGESGCGKSVTARSVLGLVEEPGRIVGGSIRFYADGAADSEAAADGEGPADGAAAEGAADTAQARSVDLAALDPRGEEIRAVRGGRIAMVFQEPMAALSPMYTVGDQLVEAIRLHLPLSREAARARAVQLLERVGIPGAERRMDAYSFQLSGGMCQRVMIAIALSCDPELLIADEPTTALDVTTQARILDLLTEIQSDSGMSVLFITHDLGVVAEIADEVVVMYLGTVVEQGPVDAIFHDPAHPYTRALLGSVPRMGAGARQRLASIRGNVPHPSERPAGCPFHPRCASAVAGVCDTAEPPETALSEDRRVRCVLHGDPPPAVPAAATAEGARA